MAVGRSVGRYSVVHAGTDDGEGRRPLRWSGFGGYNVSIEIAQLTCAVEEIYIQLFSLALLLRGRLVAAAGPPFSG